MKEIIYAVVIIILVTSSNSLGKDIKIKNTEYKRLKIAVLNFTTKNCKPYLGIYAPGALNKELYKLADNRKFIIINRNIIKKTAKKNKFHKLDCYNNIHDCILPADKRIIGLIKKAELKTEEKQLSKYVLKEIMQQEYLIIVKAVNIKNQVEIYIKEKIYNEKHLTLTMKKIAKRIIAHYSSIKKKVKKKEIVKRKGIVKKSAFRIEFDGISLSGAYFKALGKYFAIQFV